MSSSRTKKCYRATAEQLKFYADFCQKYPEMENFKNKVLSNKLWKELVEGLNSLNGPERTVQKWKMTLYTQRSQLRCRARQLKWKQGINNGGDIDRLDLGTLGIPETETKPFNSINRLDLGTLGIPEEEIKDEEEFVANPHEIFIKTEDNPIPRVATEPVKNPLEIRKTLSYPAVDLLKKQDPSLQLQQQQSATINPLLLDNELMNSESDSDSDEITKASQINRNRRQSAYATLMMCIYNREKRERKRERRQEQRDREFIATLKGLTNVIDELITLMKNSSS